MSYLKPLSIALILVFISACNKDYKPNELHFATFAEYPPFEYIEQGEIKGFDIDLARLLAKKLGKTAVFDNIQFSTILPAISAGQDEAAIATMTITPLRQKNFDFTLPYYFEGMAAVYKKSAPVTTVAALNGKKVAAQLGSVMDLWLRDHLSAKDMITFNSNNQAVEALVAGHVDLVLMDGQQAAVYSRKHEGLAYNTMIKATQGYGIALKKGSPLTKEMNDALKKLEKEGLIKELQSKWLGGAL